jgi:hypothetical protein
VKASPDPIASAKRKSRVTGKTATVWKAVPMPTAIVKPPEPENGSRTEPLL